jgi:hydroxymethylglutaryl-CoA lyase
VSEYVQVFEVGPRDGLQNEPAPIPTADKIRLIDALGDAGITHIEATSFVSPKWVPQLADAAEVMAGIRRRPGSVYAVLTPNLKGYERAVEAGATMVAVFAAASEAFSQKNINCSIAESFARFAPIIARAEADGIPVRGYVSCIVRCPYDGDIDPTAVADVSARLIDEGCFEVGLGDTVGAGTPETMTRMLEAVLKRIPANRLAGHYHDTNQRALDNIRASLDLGLRRFDSAIAGLGGCPYAPGASGNVATEGVVNLLHSLGFTTGIDVGQLNAASRIAREIKELANAVPHG